MPRPSTLADVASAQPPPILAAIKGAHSDFGFDPNSIERAYQCSIFLALGKPLKSSEVTSWKLKCINTLFNWQNTPISNHCKKRGIDTKVGVSVGNIDKVIITGNHFDSSDGARVPNHSLYLGGRSCLITTGMNIEIGTKERGMTNIDESYTCIFL